VMMWFHFPCLYFSCRDTLFTLSAGIKIRQWFSVTYKRLISLFALSKDG
jgi:hypothetical protein